MAPSPKPIASGEPCRAPIKQIVLAGEQESEREGAA